MWIMQSSYTADLEWILTFSNHRCIVSSLNLSIAVTKHHEQSHIEKESIYLAHTSTSQPKKLNAGTQKQELESVEEHIAYLLTPHELLSLSCYTIQDHLSKSGTTHSEMSPLISIINLKKCPTAQSDGDIFLDKFFSFQMCLSLWSIWLK